ncbi:hypothetical protein PF008_g16525 [Phytophthora fragariae]|uniref:Uncharacterized protein n=1 Tax=Phytophthora fragariae TaxID=53985 RepID=A0A6G0RAZ8_9STRA|nr:hypothetical protein PF008_g16525 [Phytophthora fragariae]
MIGKQLWALSTLSSWEKLVVTRFACTLFAVLSVHFVLVALCLAIAQRGQTPLFGHGLVALVLKNERAAKQALGCWVLLLVLHTWYLNVAVSHTRKITPSGTGRSGVSKFTVRTDSRPNAQTLGHGAAQGERARPRAACGRTATKCKDKGDGVAAGAPD